MEPRRSNNPHFFQQTPKKSLSHSKQDAIHFFGNSKRNFEQPSNDEFNVWSENPISHESQKNMSNFESHNDMSFRARSSRNTGTYEGSKSQQFYYPRPELKPNFSTSSASNRFANNTTNDLNYNMNNNYYQIGQHGDYLPSPSSSTSGSDNPFAPIGYSRQRSTSLLPTIGSHHISTSSHLVNNNEMKNTNSFSAYPLYVPSSSRVSVATPNDYYMMNSRLYPLESRKNPSSSLSTPIPVAVNSNTDNSMPNNTQRFNFY
ncbi:uncharacterized protein EV154DRAFT_3985 [Mucor mucedo]|uniref:uncharacterized protein n=1 Tax=Mucor mucedo TaxID=29922 RepID=UPI0022204773|nr:uncharacterized protein EV154DRAFT_3985 [Mucor mucedo]KAI7897346.1 hypothetical protein EV154DRAFT_3985 [Mucor mucedo]